MEYVWLMRNGREERERLQGLCVDEKAWGGHDTPRSLKLNP